MKSISVIIPTIHQKNNKWEEYIILLLEQLKNLSIEIIIIENKLVNQAWNEWVEKATWDIIFVLNDDIILKEQVFETLATLKEWQVYCPYSSRMDDLDTIYYDNWDNIVWFCFWMHKKDWKPIPKELVLWFWDNYIYEYMKHNILWWGYIHHWESKSLNEPKQKANFDRIIEQDKINWTEIKSKINIDLNA